MSREWKVGKQGTASAMGGAIGRAVDAPSPGKRTLTEVLQFKPQDEPSGSGSGSAGKPAPAAGSGQTGSGQTPTPAPTPGQTPNGSPAPSSSPVTTHLPTMFSKVYEGGIGRHKQFTQVYVSAGTLTDKPNIFLYFHGFYAQYGIDPAQKSIKEVAFHQTSKDKDTGEVKKWDTHVPTVPSGIDTAGEAMTRAQDKNTIAMLPQGKVGANDGGQDEGGYMQALVDGLPKFIQTILDQLAIDLKSGPLKPGNIGIAGHSSGGYEGVSSALDNAKDLKDAITDVTLMDTAYGVYHFMQTRDWMFSGGDGKHPTKTVRIIGQQDQIWSKNGYFSVFGKDALDAAVKAHHGFTVDHKRDDEGVMRDSNTTTVQHSQVMKDGKLHADILVLEFKSESKSAHQDLRDRMIDDSALSIGQGGADTADYGRRDRGMLPGKP